MADYSGPSRITPSGAPPAYNSATAVAQIVLRAGQHAQEQAATEVRIINGPRDITTPREYTRVEGEVVARNDDGSLRLRTDRGTIDVRIEGNAPPPAQGEKIILEVAPSRQALQAAPAQSPATSAPPPRSSATPVEVNVRPPQIPATPTPAPAPNPNAPPQPVRLEPVSLPEVLRVLAEPAVITAQALPPPVIQHIQQALAAVPAQITTALAAMTITPPVIDTAAPGPIVFAPIHNAGITPAAAPVDLVAPTALGTEFSAQPAPLAAFLAAIKTSASASPSIPTGETPAPSALPGILPATAQVLISGVIPTLTPETAASAALVPPQAAGSTKILPAALETVLQGAPDPVFGGNPPAGTLPALIVGHTPEQFPVLAIAAAPAAPGEPFSAQFFILHAHIDSAPHQGQPGTILLLSAAPDGTAMMPAPSVPASVLPHIAALPSMLVPEPWPLMNDLYQAIAQAAGPVAAQAFAAAMPSPAAGAAQIPPAALFFLAALRGGDMSQWMSEKSLDALRRDGRNLMSRLAGETGALSRLAAEPVGDNWRPVSLPLFWQGEIHKLTLHYRHERDGSPDDAAGGGKTVRFIFDLKLSAMGQVQLDGLYRGQRLDLILRAETPFSGAMQAEMRRAYAGALSRTNIIGDLSFQNGQWVTINARREGYGTRV